ncbi:MAG: helix-turn-helix transcriptional regulator [Nanoarchaeota archaeon]
MKDFGLITPLQFATLSLVENESLEGPELRKRLKSKFGYNAGRATYYEMLGRLKNDSLMEGSYCLSETRGQIVRAKIYSATEKGKNEMKRARDFYKSVDKID